MKHLYKFTFIIFFFSGLSALCYELCWLKSLSYVFGASTQAFSTVLTVFIAGLALGTYFSGQIIEKFIEAKASLESRIVTLLLIFALAELLLAVYSFTLPKLLSQAFLLPLWSQFAPALIDNEALSLSFRFLLATAVLILPTCLMGLSFPLLSEIISLKKESQKINKPPAGTQILVSNLYAINVFGSVFGALITAYILMPSLGLQKSMYIAASINLLIALSSILLIYFSEFKQHCNFISLKSFVLYSKQPKVKAFSKNFLFLLLIVFFLGFINLALEIIWQKILALVIGSSTYSASLILATVLAGISLGGLLLNYLIRFIANKIRFLELSLFVFAILIFVSSSLFNESPWLFLSLNQKVNALIELLPPSLPGFSWLLENLAKLTMVSLIVLPVTITEGLIVAYILHYVASEKEEAFVDTSVGTRVSYASSVNTLGAIGGPFCAGFIMIPFFAQLGGGLYRSLQLILVLAFLLVLLPRLMETRINISKYFRFALTLALLAIFFVINLPRIDAHEISSGVGVYHNLKYKQASKQAYKKSIENEILFHQEGANNIVTVEKDDYANAIFLKNNGKIEAGVPLRAIDYSQADLRTQVLLGEIPGIVFTSSNLLKDKPKALLIGLGSGVSLNSLLKSADFAEVDVCEIEKLVFFAAKKYFSAYEYDFSSIRDQEIKDSMTQELKEKQTLVKEFNTDARNLLQSSTDNHYDIIVSQPSDPWISSSLFTDEFWSLAKSKMKEDGVFMQWLQLYAISTKHLKIAIKTFQQNFPYVMAFKAESSSELMLLGSNSPIKFDVKKIAENMKKPLVKHDLVRIGIYDYNDFLSTVALGYESFAGVKKDTKRSKTNTDDNMLLEFHTSRKLKDFYKSIKNNTKYLSKKIHFVLDPDKAKDNYELLTYARKLISQLQYRKNLDTNAKYILLKEMFAKLKRNNSSAYYHLLNHEFLSLKARAPSLNRVLKKNFDINGVYDELALAELYLKNNQAEKAKLYLEGIGNIDEESRYFRNWLAETLILDFKKTKNRFSYQKAKKILQKLIDEDIFNPQYFASLAELEYVKGASEKLVRELAIQALSFDYHNLKANLVLANLEFDITKGSYSADYTQSLRFINNARSINSYHPVMNYLSLMTNYKIGRLDQALNNLHKLESVCEADLHICQDELIKFDLKEYEIIKARLKRLVPNK